MAELTDVKEKENEWKTNSCHLINKILRSGVMVTGTLGHSKRDFVKCPA